MEKQIIKKIIIKGEDGRILSQLYCDNGLSVNAKYYKEKLSEVEIYANNRYAGAIECWRGVFEEQYFFWNENGDMVFCDKEGNPINGI